MQISPFVCPTDKQIIILYFLGKSSVHGDQTYLEKHMLKYFMKINFSVAVILTGFERLASNTAIPTILSLVLMWKKMIVTSVIPQMAGSENTHLHCI